MSADAHLAVWCTCLDCEADLTVAEVDINDAGFPCCIICGSINLHGRDGRPINAPA